MEEGGSLTIIATALIDTGSRMDEVIFEEFKGTGNCEIHLDRRLYEKRVFPSIQLNRCGTRREELLLAPEILQKTRILRQFMYNMDEIEAMEMVLKSMKATKTNVEFFDMMRRGGWRAWASLDAEAAEVTQRPQRLKQWFLLRPCVPASCTASARSARSPPRYNPGFPESTPDVLARLPELTRNTMKEGIHPNYRDVCFVDLSNGFKFVTRSCVTPRKWARPTTAASCRCSSWTPPANRTRSTRAPRSRSNDMGGRVDKFFKKFGKTAAK